MTLLGELYANGLGVGRDDNKAADWFTLAADRGDREAMFALAMFSLAGRAGPRDREAAAKLLARRGQARPCRCRLRPRRCSISKASCFRRISTRAAELFRTAADAGSPEAQYALATLYKDGRGVPQDMREAARLLVAAALADNIDAAGRIRVSRCSTALASRKNENAAAALFQQSRAERQRRSRRIGSRIIFATGRGAAADPIAATKWHLISKARGETDSCSTTSCAAQTPTSAPPARTPPSPGSTPSSAARASRS